MVPKRRKGVYWAVITTDKECGMIWVDADACPVKGEVETIAVRHKTLVKMVCDGGLRPSQNPFVEMVYVTEGLDAADNYIAENCGPGQIVLTNDIPLADRALQAGAWVMRFDGEELTNRNIAAKLAARNAADAARAEAPLMAEGGRGGGKAFGPRDRQRFKDALERALRAIAATR